VVSDIKRDPAGDYWQNAITDGLEHALEIADKALEIAEQSRAAIERLSTRIDELEKRGV
jgi:hypothetical protein